VLSKRNEGAGAGLIGERRAVLVDERLELIEVRKRRIVGGFFEVRREGTEALQNDDREADAVDPVAVAALVPERHAEPRAGLTHDGIRRDHGGKQKTG
jgi:hypothetical protein